jgi:hypothetical protein
LAKAHQPIEQAVDGLIGIESLPALEHVEKHTEVIEMVCKPKGGMLASMPVAIPDFDEIPLGPLVARTAVSVWHFGGLLMLGGLMRAAWFDCSLERS